MNPPDNCIFNHLSELHFIDAFEDEQSFGCIIKLLYRSRKSLWQILQSYLTRWRIEETIRFMKQSYQVEDIRLLTYHRLQNMMVILTAVSYFAMVYLGLKTKLRVLARHVMGAARRLFGIPDFHFYALAVMVFVSIFSGVRRAYKAFFSSGMKKIISCFSSIHNFWGNSSCFIP